MTKNPYRPKTLDHEVWEFDHTQRGSGDTFIAEIKRAIAWYKKLKLKYGLY